MNHSRSTVHFFQLHTHTLKLQNNDQKLFNLQNLTENKLKAFNIGTMNAKKGLSKKEQEDYRKKVRF